MNKSSKNYISESAAIELLKRIFSTTPESEDMITLDEVYVAAGRAEVDPETNRNWLNTVMTKLRDHNLVTPVYTYDGRKKLSDIQLTVAGKSALGKTIGIEAKQPTTLPDTSQPQAVDLTLDEILTAVEALSKKHTTFDITLTIKPKEQSSEHR